MLNALLSASDDKELHGHRAVVILAADLLESWARAQDVSAIGTGPKPSETRLSASAIAREHDECIRTTMCATISQNEVIQPDSALNCRFEQDPILDEEDLLSAVNIGFALKYGLSALRNVGHGRAPSVSEQESLIPVLICSDNRCGLIFERRY